MRNDTDPGTRHVVLVGPMGAGKSTLGSLLAQRLHLPFVDLDSWIERDDGRSIATIFAEAGESGFRALERAALQAALADPPSVIATGGGAVLEAGNRAAMRSHATVVYLQVDPALQCARLAGDATRPLLQGGNPAATLARLQAEREPLYRATAHRVFDSGALPPERAADALAGLLPQAIA